MVTRLEKRGQVLLALKQMAAAGRLPAWPLEIATHLGQPWCVVAGAPAGSPLASTLFNLVADGLVVRFRVGRVQSRYGLPGPGPRRRTPHSACAGAPAAKNGGGEA